MLIHTAEKINSPAEVCVSVEVRLFFKNSIINPCSRQQIKSGHAPKINMFQLHHLRTIVALLELLVEICFTLHTHLPSASHIFCSSATDIMCLVMVYLRTDTRVRNLCHSVTARLYDHIRGAWNKVPVSQPSPPFTRLFLPLYDILAVFFLNSLIFPHLLRHSFPFGLSASFLSLWKNKEEKESFTVNTKTKDRKLCRNIWSVFLPQSLFWEMSSTPKEQFQKKHKVAD